MKIRNILPLMFVFLWMFLGCTVDDDGVVMLIPSYPEYDYVEDCDVFSGGYDFVNKAFKKANTYIAPFSSGGNPVSHTGIFYGYENELQQFVNDNSDQDANGDLVGHSYIAGVSKATAFPKFLGYTLSGGKDGKAACFIFKDNISAFALQVYIDDDIVRKGAVLHELGHLRADLGHFCNGNQVHPDHDYSQLYVCIMSINWPTPNCYNNNISNDKPLKAQKYCKFCIDSLRKIDWEE